MSVYLSVCISLMCMIWWNDYVFLQYLLLYNVFLFCFNMYIAAKNITITGHVCVCVYVRVCVCAYVHMYVSETRLSVMPVLWKETMFCFVLSSTLIVRLAIGERLFGNLKKLLRLLVPMKVRMFFSLFLRFYGMCVLCYRKCVIYVLSEYISH